MKEKKEQIRLELLRLYKSDTKDVSQFLPIIEKILAHPVIRKQLRLLAIQDLKAESSGKLPSQKVADRVNDFFLPLARDLLTRLFCPVPEDIKGRVLSVKEHSDYKKIEIQCTLGIRSAIYIQIISLYFETLLFDLKTFPFFGMAFIDFAKWRLKSNTQNQINKPSESQFKSQFKTFKKRYRQACWDILPQNLHFNHVLHIKETISQLIALVPTSRHRIITMLERRRNKKDYPTIDIAFTDEVVLDADFYLRRLYKQFLEISDNPQAIDSLLGVISIFDASYKRLLSDITNRPYIDPEKQTAEDEIVRSNQDVEFTVTVCVHFVLSGIKTMIDEMISCNEELFIREWIPILLADAEFIETFEDFKNVHPSRWRHTAGGRLDVINFACNGIKIYLTKEMFKGMREFLQGDENSRGEARVREVSFRENHKEPHDSHKRYYCLLGDLSTATGCPKRTAIRHFDRLVEQGVLRIGIDVDRMPMGNEYARIVYKNSYTDVRDYFLQRHPNTILTKQLADPLSVHPNTIRKWSKSGKLMPFRDEHNKYRYYKIPESLSPELLSVLRNDPDLFKKFKSLPDSYEN